MVCCKAVKRQYDIEVVEAHQSGKTQGRSYKELCPKRFFQITLVVGIILGLLGGLALLSLLLPNGGAMTPFLQRVAEKLITVAGKLGTDPMSLGVVTASLGGAFIIAGSFGWAVENCKRREPLANKIQRREEVHVQETPGNPGAIVMSDRHGGTVTITS